MVGAQLAVNTTAILVDAIGPIQEPLQMASRVSALYSSQPPFPLVISLTGRESGLQANLTFSAGTELVGLAASETPNPRETMPAAVKGTFWRIVSLSLLSDYIQSMT